MLAKYIVKEVARRVGRKLALVIRALCWPVKAVYQFVVFVFTWADTYSDDKWISVIAMLFSAIFGGIAVWDYNARNSTNLPDGWWLMWAFVSALLAVLGLWSLGALVRWLARLVLSGVRSVARTSADVNVAARQTRWVEQRMAQHTYAPVQLLRPVEMSPTEETLLRPVGEVGIGQIEQTTGVSPGT